jgi:beta-glucosidase-like glycosyl hydrolase
LEVKTDRWVDSVMQRLTIDQKIGQLFMIQAYANNKNQSIDEILKVVRDYEVGGIIFMQGDPLEQARMTNFLQKNSRIPLLVACDAETGLGFRLDSTISYPTQMALGAIKDDSLIFRMGFEIGMQCRLVGINMNMAPVCDVNQSSENPAINSRSFGEDRLVVARKSWMYASGLQSAGVLATAKHFPGHGNTDTDSHHALPLVSEGLTQLDSIDLFPFSYLIKNGIGAVMTGHLGVAAMEPDLNLPASLSKIIVTKKLKDDLKFNGLIITDAMNMKGVSNNYSSAESSVLALKAGNDMIEIVPRLDRAVESVKSAIANGELSVAEIDEKCRKILLVKKWLGLDQFKPVNSEKLIDSLNSNTFKRTKRQLSELSVTLLKNELNVIPLKNLDTLKLASLMIGAETISPFQKMLDKYSEIDHFNAGSSLSDEEIEVVARSLKPYNLVLVGIGGMGSFPVRRFGITDQEIKLISKLDSAKIVFCFFGNPYALPNFPTIKNCRGLLVTYQDDTDMQEMAAQLIFGATAASGTLPVTVKGWYPLNSGIQTKALGRLKYSFPGDFGIDMDFLEIKLIHRLKKE